MPRIRKRLRRHHRARAVGFGALALCLAGAACADERGRPAPVTCPTWRGPIEALVADRCVPCHGDTDPAGDYALVEYLDALATGSDDVPNAIAGEPASLILTVLADEVHEGVTDAAEALSTWVVSCDLAYVSSRVHERGLMNPHDDGFHGALVRDVAFDFGLCDECHDAERATLCASCHPAGVADCTTCHGADLVESSGAHAAHLLPTPIAGGIACETCHVVPETFDAPGHVFTAAGEVDPPPAEVRFSGLAGQDARYVEATRTCAGVYCHGATLDDPAAALTQPAWTAGAAAGDCGACHGAPPADHHGAERCGACHAPAAVAGGLEPALHVDGTVQVGRDCTDCHGGGPAGPAPPPDLEGQVSTDALGVGAHLSHVLAPSRISAPIPCSACHLVPEDVHDPGHIDSPQPAEVFPGDAAFGGLASARGAEPMWLRDSASCAGVYCHGGGALELAGGPFVNATPVWTAVDAGEVFCGSCHGIPPQDETHSPALGLGDCVTCHPRTVDAFGNIIAGPTSEHIDGTVDL